MQHMNNEAEYVKMVRRSEASGSIPRLAYGLFFAVGCLLLLLFSTWSRVATTYCFGQTHSSLPVKLIRQPGLANVSTTAGAAAAVLAANSTGPSGPPYRFPKLIHQTVSNKSRVACEEQRVIQSWKELNPGYTHRLWDDNDIRQFMVENYPDMVPVPFDELLNGAERSDIWRVLVLHKYGGVYADIDVMCLRPIDEWNANHNHDAAVILGIEDFDSKRKPHSLHVNNWAIASMPGHPLLGRFPAVVARHIQRQYFAAARKSGQLSPALYEQGVLERTGPDALTAAMYDYVQEVGVDMNNVTQPDLGGEQGFVAGGVRVVSVDTLSSGWQVADARQKQRAYDCSNIAVDHPEALVCHLFWGTWRSTWNFKQRKTYNNC